MAEKQPKPSGTTPTARPPVESPLSATALENLTPIQIVAELNRYIIGQQDAKRAVAVALRNRYRRQLLPEDMRQEIQPKNILMIGPTGVGKTEIARRVARLINAPLHQGRGDQVHRGWLRRAGMSNLSSGTWWRSRSPTCTISAWSR